MGPGGAVTLAVALITSVMSAGIAPAMATLAVVRRAWRAVPDPPREPERILVLGHRLESGVLSADFVQRLARGLILARRYPAARLVLLGGRDPRDEVSEAEAGRDWLVAHGLDAARITVETESRDTLGNFRNHRSLHGIGGVEALVTSRFHLQRAVLMAEGFGLAPMPVAAEDRPRIEAVRMMGEGFRVHWYLTARLLARMLGRRVWLGRIS